MAEEKRKSLNRARLMSSPPIFGLFGDGKQNYGARGQVLWVKEGWRPKARESGRGRCPRKPQEGARPPSEDEWKMPGLEDETIRES
ncbi:hypothetical protein GE21DRAFT_1216307 [Neurospora crassa]|nr:hypothetical protein GE21DRAFT_1216307 [Neurospora crassa]